MILYLLGLEAMRRKIPELTGIDNVLPRCSDKQQFFFSKREFFFRPHSKPIERSSGRISFFWWTLRQRTSSNSHWRLLELPEKAGPLQFALEILINARICCWNPSAESALYWVRNSKSLYFPGSVVIGLLDFSGTSWSRQWELEYDLWRKIHQKELIGLLDCPVGLLCGLKKKLSLRKKKLLLIGTSVL